MGAEQRNELESRAKRVFEVVDSQEPEGLEELVHADVQMLFLGIPFDGLEAVIEMLRGLYVALPDQVHAIEHVVTDVETAQVALQTRLSGTHEGPFETFLGPIEGSGRKVSWGSGTFLRFRDGKVHEWEVYLDQVTVISELGVDVEAFAASVEARR